MEDVLTKFGLKIRSLRKEKGWSQEQLAAICQLDRTYIGSIERGERNIALLNITKLASALSVTPSNLLDFDTLNE